MITMLNDERYSGYGNLLKWTIECVHGKQNTVGQGSYMEYLPKFT